MEERILDSEKRSHSTNPEGKFPTFLLVLLIITSLNVVYSLYNTISDLIVSDKVKAQLREDINELVIELSSEFDTMPEFISADLEDFFDKMIANYDNYMIYSLLFYALLGLSTTLMFKLRKAGYHLYVMLQIVGTVEYFFFFGLNWITISMGILTGILALIFILLYRANRHYLH